MSTPTRYPNGVTNNKANNIFADLPILDPTKVWTYFDDFNTFTATDWTITTVELGAGAATETVTTGNGGILLVTNDAADNDSDSLQLVAAPILMQEGKKLWFKARFAISDATQSDLFFGLSAIDTSPFAGTANGIYIRKVDASTSFTCTVENNSQEVSVSAAGTLADATFTEIAFKYNGKDTVTFFQDGVTIAEIASDGNIPTAAGRQIAPTFQIINGEADAKTLSVDYIFVAQER